MSSLFSAPTTATLRRPGSVAFPRPLPREPLASPTSPSTLDLSSEASPSVTPLPPAGDTAVLRPRWTLSDLVLSDSVRRQLATLLSRIRNHDLIYHRWEMAHIDPIGSCRSINLYGPPGTGKSMTAEALAHALNCPLLPVNYAELESKYVGETPRNICHLFAAATRASAVLFFDEADALLSSRLTNISQAADQAANLSRAVLLKQLDDFRGIVIFATNLARNFDAAFVRRILLHVELPLPDESCRTRLWQTFLRPAVPGREKIDWSKLAQLSAGLSGGDIKNALLLALADLAENFQDGDQLTTAHLTTAISLVTRGKQDVGGEPTGLRATPTHTAVC
ncbi:MAG: AAA family ATPase [Pirellulales bacterium]